MRSFSRVTPQTTRLLTEDPQNHPTFDGEQAQMSQAALVASAQAQNFFIHTTSVLKAAFLKTPTPSDTEKARLAAKTGLDEYRVSTWFDIIRSLSEDSGLRNLPTSEVTQASVPPSPTFSDVFGFSPTLPIGLDLMQNAVESPTRPLQTKVTKRRRRLSIGNSRPTKRQRKDEASQNRTSSWALDNRQALHKVVPARPRRKNNTAVQHVNSRPGKWINGIRTRLESISPQ